MATDRQLLANRRNGALSRGPKTAAGKARSSRNALRHGLAVPLSRDPRRAEEINALARALTGPDAGDAAHPALIAAEAQLELERVRATRVSMVEQTVIDAGDPPHDALDDPDFLVRVLPRLDKLDRYERRALSRRKRALRTL